jgi:dienelactone hydrolase
MKIWSSRGDANAKACFGFVAPSQIDSCSGRIAVIGFCMGGRTAFLAAARAAPASEASDTSAFTRVFRRAMRGHSMSARAGHPPEAGSSARGGIDAAIAVYALGIRQHLDDVPRIACPLQLHYGLADVHIPRAEIDEVIAATTANKRIETHLYPGAGHGFFNPLRPTYDADAVALAKQRIDGLLNTLS